MKFVLAFMVLPAVISFSASIYFGYEKVLIFLAIICIIAVLRKFISYLISEAKRIKKEEQEKENQRIKKEKEDEEKRLERNKRAREREKQRRREDARQKRNEKARIKRKKERAKQNKQKKLIEKYGEKIGKKLFNKKIWRGMTKRMLVDSRGRPKKELKSFSKEITKLEWYYEPRKTRQGTTKYKYKVVLENDIVEEMKEQE